MSDSSFADSSLPYLRSVFDEIVQCSTSPLIYKTSNELYFQFVGNTSGETIKQNSLTKGILVIIMSTPVRLSFSNESDLIVIKGNLFDFTPRFLQMFQIIEAKKIVPIPIKRAIVSKPTSPGSNLNLESFPATEDGFNQFCLETAVSKATSEFETIKTKWGSLLETKEINNKTNLGNYMKTIKPGKTPVKKEPSTNMKVIISPISGNRQLITKKGIGKFDVAAFKKKKEQTEEEEEDEEDSNEELDEEVVDHGTSRVDEDSSDILLEEFVNLCSEIPAGMITKKKFEKFNSLDPELTGLKKNIKEFREHIIECKKEFAK